MANYYNVAAWKRTGFDTYNRPYSRDVLASDEFSGSATYVQVDGIALGRTTMEGLITLKVPGSVKDIKGTQQNPPNSTGKHGPGGAFYSWEEVDYVRITRTGYPGDNDYVDISENQKDPWNTPHEGAKLFVGYYFVTGMKPLARNVTMLFLAMDYWTTCGAADELEIESGFKIAGHITDKEDAETYNLYPSPIGLTEPLEVKSLGYVDGQWDVDGDVNIIISAADLSQYSNEQEIPALVAQISTGQSVAIPKILTTERKTRMELKTPSESGEQSDTLEITGYGFYDGDNAIVQNGLSVLYSAGQLELQDSFTIPRGYFSASVTANGIMNDFHNVSKEIACPVTPDIGSYPRKADYMYGEYVLFSASTGSMDVESFYDVRDSKILIWAVITPGGSPLARFKGIKNHAYPYDKVVAGMPWMKKAITMQGASGSMWNQINNAFAQQTQDRNIAMNKNRNSIQTARLAIRGIQTAAEYATSIAGVASSSVSPKNFLEAGGSTIEAISKVTSAATNVANFAVDAQAEINERKFNEQALNQAQSQINAGFAQQEMQSPYTSFIPDLNVASFHPNTFGVYIVNTSKKDRERLKNYYKRFGYDGLYKPLTWDEIRVKENVNFIRAENVVMRHEYYPMRVLKNVTEILQNGVFLWNKKPNQNLFNDNPDKTT